MHFAWTVLIAWNARSRWLRAGLWLFAGLTALATLGLGLHYLVDLVAALPYSALVQWLAQSRSKASPETLEASNKSRGNATDSPAARVPSA